MIIKKIAPLVGSALLISNVSVASIELQDKLPNTEFVSAYQSRSDLANDLVEYQSIPGSSRMLYEYDVDHHTASSLAVTCDGDFNTTGLSNIESTTVEELDVLGIPCQWITAAMHNTPVQVYQNSNFWSSQVKDQSLTAECSDLLRGVILDYACKAADYGLAAQKKVSSLNWKLGEVSWGSSNVDTIQLTFNLYEGGHQGLQNRTIGEEL